MTGSHGREEWKNLQEVSDAPGQKQGTLNLKDEPDVKKSALEDIPVFLVICFSYDTKG